MGNVGPCAMTPPARDAAAQGGAGSAESLGVLDVASVVIGGIVGVGIFFTPAKVAARVDGPALVVLAWGLGGLLAVLGALVFAELSTLVPGHGGTYRYVLCAFGRLPAFLYGWANWLVIQAGALGVVGLLLVDHLDIAIGGRASLRPGAKVALAAAAILLFTGTNVFGFRVGKRVQNALTLSKILALAFLVSLAAFAGGAEAGPAPPTHRPVLSQLGGAMLPVLFAIGGWQQGSFLAGAARNPLRTVPLGILGGVLVVVVCYLSVNLAYLDLLGFEGARTSSAIGADAARAALGSAGGRVLAAMVAVSAAGIMNTICMAPPYVLLAMAREGAFPRAFARLSPRYGTPVLGVLGQGIWAVLLLVLAHATASVLGYRAIGLLGFLCDGVVFVDWVFFALCGAALLRLRSRRGPGAFRAPMGRLVALSFTLAALLVAAAGVASEEQRVPSLAGAGLVLLGLPFARRLGSGSPPTSPLRR
ncbi:MAG: hypothetical protein Fur0037_22610 [Planctomycetota bacterium]